jgi:trafficking protein particle complex subunit 8
VSRTHPYILGHLYPFIFPLYNPASVDIVVFWDIPSEQRSGHICIAGITLGASHAALKEVIEAIEGAKVKRSMYAETQREKAEILDSIKESEWNAEMNPLVLSLQGTGTLLHDFTQGFVEVRSSIEAMADIPL